MSGRSRGRPHLFKQWAMNIITLTPSAYIANTKKGCNLKISKPPSCLSGFMVLIRGVSEPRAHWQWLCIHKTMIAETSRLLWMEWRVQTGLLIHLESVGISPVVCVWVGGWPPWWCADWTMCGLSGHILHHLDILTYSYSLQVNRIHGWGKSSLACYDCPTHICTAPWWHLGWS